MATDMNMRFNRSLSPAFEKCLSQGEPLRFLLERPTIHGDDPVPLEPHLREDDHLMLYAGRTRVVDLEYRDGQLVPRADESYDMVGHGVRRRYACADAGRLAADLRDYLSKVVARPQFVRGEGRCHAWLSRHFGAERNATGWVTVDSESVFGFADAAEKELFWSPIRAMEREARAILAAAPARFGRGVASGSFGDEVDLLLWDSQVGEFIVTEVKDGGKGAGVYLSPLQVGCYVLAWRRFAAIAPHVALSGLRELVLQRRRLGLIRGDCRPPETTADLRFRPVVVVQAPNKGSTCWAKLAEVRRAVERAWQQTDMGGPTAELLGGLSVLALRDDQLDDITQKCMNWRRCGREQQP